MHSRKYGVLRERGSLRTWAGAHPRAYIPTERRYQVSREQDYQKPLQRKKPLYKRYDRHKVQVLSGFFSRNFRKASVK